MDAESCCVRSRESMCCIALHRAYREIQSTAGDASTACTKSVQLLLDLGNCLVPLIVTTDTVTATMGDDGGEIFFFFPSLSFLFLS